ncbi:MULTISPECIES: phospholipid phosphatase [Leptotrichia]|uniref:phospholipid phosphatase n=1 Tax=Leptotrichia TaxID=32067 RepID=UPI0015BC7ED5|nr:MULTISPECIES: phospholipid phosphatase [Leptotrichia]NWO18587.1 phospholipid phosphatase [Leptotrichia sp. oral taxon 223]
MKENRELRRHKDEKLRVLLITIVTYFVFLIIKKMGIVTPYLGIVMLILLYMYANYNLINMFFISKRTTFKIYAFLLLEVIYLYTFNISIRGAILYVIFFSLLFFSIRKDEGREEIPKITKFVQIFLIFKVVFVLTMLIF